MFCSHCGKENADTSRFCGGCGHPLDPVESAAVDQRRTPGVAPSNGGWQGGCQPAPTMAKKSYVTGIACAVLALITLMPWVSLDVYFADTSQSLPGLAQLAVNYSEVAGYASDEAYGMLMVIGCFLFVMWLITIGCLVYAAYQNFAKDKSFMCGYWANLTTVVVVIAICALADFSIAQQSGSTFGVQLSGIITATIWPWISGVASVVLIGMNARNKKQQTS
ncbi:zinc ribbon domain-containing protein [Slackia piriformis]|nr:zinc ribbon domain-containing protein [Slackia piriformis]